MINERAWLIVCSPSPASPHHIILITHPIPWLILCKILKVSLSKPEMNILLERWWMLASYPWENCPSLSLRLMLVPGGRSSWLLPLGMEMVPSGMWISPSGGLIGTASSDKGVGDEMDPSFWIRGPEITGASAGAWFWGMEAGEMDDVSGGAGGVPYTGAGA
jgi:hypothetical protein